MGPLVELAATDLAEMLGIDLAAHRRVCAGGDLADTSIGCPQPGMRYP